MDDNRHSVGRARAIAISIAARQNRILQIAGMAILTVTGLAATLIHNAFQ